MIKNEYKNIKSKTFNDLKYSRMIKEEERD